MNFQCPECDQQLEAADELAGEECECPECGTLLTLPRQQPEKPKRQKPQTLPSQREPNVLPSMREHQRPQKGETNWHEYRARLIKYKKFWDALESRLQKMRDSFEIEGRISREDKATMIVEVLKRGENWDALPEIIEKRFQKYLARDAEPERSASGCAVFFALAAFVTVLIRYAGALLA